MIHKLALTAVNYLVAIVLFILASCIADYYCFASMNTPLYIRAKLMIALLTFSWYFILLSTNAYAPFVITLIGLSVLITILENTCDSLHISKCMPALLNSTAYIIVFFTTQSSELHYILIYGGLSLVSLYSFLSNSGFLKFLTRQNSKAIICEASVHFAVALDHGPAYSLVAASNILEHGYGS